MSRPSVTLEDVITTNLAGARRTLTLRPKHGGKLTLIQSRQNCGVWIELGREITSIHYRDVKAIEFLERAALEMRERRQKEGL